ncbi:hypothetical protein APY03_2423 [Variovorax sp. WDL1]|nr:hypothetical protein APY03_2423 [Variovorax sp. WDL1]
MVDDLSFIENKQGILYSDADIYGIRIEEANLADITPIAR